MIVPRRAAESDARAAADLWLRSRRAAAGAIPLPVHDDGDVRAWFGSHVVQDAELWLAEATGGLLVGILVLDGPWIDQLYVEPSLTSNEIGSQLVRFAKRARPDGLQLWTFESNTGAQRFYQRHGFAAVTRTDGRDNQEGAPDICTHGMASEGVDRGDVGVEHAGR